MPELPDAKKWALGFTDVTRWLKDLGTLIRIIAIIGIAYLLYVGGTAIWRKVVPPKPIVPVVETLNCEKGTCDMSTGDKSKKFNFGFVNIR